MLVVALAACCALPATAAAKPVAGQVRIAIDGAAARADFSHTSGRADVVVLQAWEADKLRALKARNPGIKVLMYRNLSAMSTADRWGNTGTGVTTQDAGSHPEWYLRNTSGERFTFSSYNFLWAADIGNRSFQERWLANVTAKLNDRRLGRRARRRRQPDDALPLRRRAVAKYPSDAAYSAATGSALAFIGPRLRAPGQARDPQLRRLAPLPQHRHAVAQVRLRRHGGALHEVRRLARRRALHRRRLGRPARRPQAGAVDGQALPRRRALVARRPRGGALRLGDDAAGGPTARPASRCTTTTPAKPGSPSTATTSARRRAGSPRTPAGSTGAPSPAASCSSTRRRSAGPSASAAAIAAPASASRAAPSCGRTAASSCSPRAAAPRTRPASAARCASASPAARHARPCRRTITVAVRAKGRRVVVGHRRVAVRRTAHVRVRLSAKGRTGRRLRVSVRARR